VPSKVSTVIHPTTLSCQTSVRQGGLLYFSGYLTTQTCLLMRLLRQPCVESWHQNRLLAVMCTAVFVAVFLTLEVQINSYAGQWIASDETNHSCVVDFLLFYKKGGSHVDIWTGYTFLTHG
jgi:hypothetical protein